MNNHDYHMINEDSLRSSSNNHQEFFQSYLSNSNPASTNNNVNTEQGSNEAKLQISDYKSTIPLLALKQPSANYRNETNFMMKYRYWLSRHLPANLGSTHVTVLPSLQLETLARMVLGCPLWLSPPGKVSAKAQRKWQTKF